MCSKDSFPVSPAGIGTEGQIKFCVVASGVTEAFECLSLFAGMSRGVVVILAWRSDRCGISSSSNFAGIKWPDCCRCRTQHSKLSTFCVAGLNLLLTLNLFLRLLPKAPMRLEAVRFINDG